MKSILQWLNSALADNDFGSAMTYYRVAEGTISASNNNIVANYPWPYKGEFLVPGIEFEKIVNRMKDEPTIIEVEGAIKLKAGRFSSTIQTLPLNDWSYDNINDIKWEKLPTELLPLLAALRPFLSNDATQAWSRCIALESGWAFATNNIAIAGGPCKGLGNVKALLPSWTIDFLLERLEGLIEYSCTDSFIIFRWENGAWMKSQLIVGKFPEKASSMVKQSFDEKPTQKITEELRIAFQNIGELAEDTLIVYANRIESKFGKAIIEENIKSEIPKGEKQSIWGARFLLPAILAADSWSPGLWPAPAPWKGKLISGYIVGRRI